LGRENGLVDRRRTRVAQGRAADERRPRPRRIPASGRPNRRPDAFTTDSPVDGAATTAKHRLVEPPADPGIRVGWVFLGSSAGWIRPQPWFPLGCCGLVAEGIVGGGEIVSDSLQRTPRVSLVAIYSFRSRRPSGVCVSLFGWIPTRRLLFGTPSGRCDRVYGSTRCVGPNPGPCQVWDRVQTGPAGWCISFTK
jgi:hypothetical protein